MEECQSQEIISYFDMPTTLIGKYQDYTQADIVRLREAGYDRNFISLEAGVRGYVEWLGQDILANSYQSNTRQSQS